MGKIITITSGKGGVGKTTICAYLGMQLSKIYKKSVCVVDADFGLNNLDLVLGLENRVVYDILDVIHGKCRLVQALVEHPCCSNLYILPSIKLKNLQEIKHDDFKEIINIISKTFDYVLIDCPAGIDYAFERAISPSNEAIVVAIPSITALRDVGKIINKLNNFNIDKIGLVVNRVRGDLILAGEMVHPEDIEELLDVDLIGTIPECDSMNMVGQLSGFEFGLDNETLKAFEALAKSVEFNEKNNYDYLKNYKNIFSSIKRIFKKMG